MKRAFSVLLALCLCFLLAMSAFADVIYEPEDEFFEKHREECYYENRVYIAAGEEGHATVMKDPKSGKSVKELSNGTEAYVGWIWEGDGGWAQLEGYGWVRMTELTVKYDATSFAEEHGSEFLYLDEWEFIDLADSECLQLWRYPGDTESFTSLSWTGENAWFSEPPEDLSFNTIYEDPEGRRWGYIHYFYGYRNCWVCLTDPDAAWFGAKEPQPTAQPVETVPTEAPVVSASPAPTAAPASPQPTELPPIIDPEPPRPFPWLPAGLAAGAVVIAGALLAVFRKKK